MAINWKRFFPKNFTAKHFIKDYYLKCLIFWLIKKLRIDAADIELNLFRETFWWSPEEPIVSSTNDVKGFLFSTSLIFRSLSDDIGKVGRGTLERTEVAQFLLLHILFLKVKINVNSNFQTISCTMKHPLSVIVIGSSSEVMNVKRQSVRSASVCSMQVYWRNSKDSL